MHCVSYSLSGIMGVHNDGCLHKCGTGFKSWWASCLPCCAVSRSWPAFCFLFPTDGLLPHPACLTTSLPKVFTWPPTCCLPCQLTTPLPAIYTQSVYPLPTQPVRLHLCLSSMLARLLPTQLAWLLTLSDPSHGAGTLVRCTMTGLVFWICCLLITHQWVPSNPPSSCFRPSCADVGEYQLQNSFLSGPWHPCPPYKGLRR